MSDKPGFIVQKFPSSRKFTADIGYLGLRKHRVQALIEVDVTDSRALLQAYRQERNVEVSFTAWILKCISQAVHEHKSMHALRQGRNRLIIFDDIDISILIEKEIDGQKVPLPVVLRKTNKKSPEELHAEIQAAKAQPVRDEKDYVLGDAQHEWGIKLFLALPQFLRLILWRLILSNPHRMQKMMGTVVVTSVGMVGNLKGWVIPASIHPICFALGSIVRKPGVSGEQIAIREYLPVTVLIDHDVVDGAPATRFLSRLTEIIEAKIPALGRKNGIRIEIFQEEDAKCVQN